MAPIFKVFHEWVQEGMYFLVLVIEFQNSLLIVAYVMSSIPKGHVGYLE